MIEFRTISKSYGKNIRALKNISFKIDRGEFVFLIGPSGAGKSTVIRLILKETQPDAGKIIFKGTDITRVRRRRVPEIRKEIGVVFQDFRLLEDKTVEGNIGYVMDILGVSRRVKKKRIQEVLDLVDLYHRRKSYPHELSGGEQQRVSIARSMVNKPDFLIADELTGNLDPETSWEIVDTLKRINNQGTTVLMITHDYEIVNHMKKRVLQLRDGLLVRDEEGGAYLEKD